MKSIFSAVLLVALTGTARAQDVPETPGERRATVTVGLGNSMGWLGAQGERYFSGDRMSVFGGVGYVFELEDDGEVFASGAALAAGVRAYTRGRVHRGFVELSLSCVSTESAFAPARADDLSLYYGPGLQVGYQLAARGGFTFMASVGGGLALGDTNGQSRGALLLGLGIGKTWRRK